MQVAETRMEQVAVVDGEQLPLPLSAAVSIGRFAGFDADGRFRIQSNRAAGPETALSTIALTLADVDAQVVIACENGSGRPIIIGRVYERIAPTVPEVKVDGERVVIRAKREIELCCGDASIVLTSSGKVIIHGSYVVSRSRGANKVKGAIVDIN